MESSLEPELSMSLKIQLAENLNHPERHGFKQVTLLMEDMLRAVEKGQTELSPRTKRKYYDDGLKAKNKFLESQAQKKQQQLELKKNKDQQFKERHLKIKEDLKIYSKEKQEKK